MLLLVYRKGVFKDRKKTSLQTPSSGDLLVYSPSEAQAEASDVLS